MWELLNDNDPLKIPKKRINTNNLILGFDPILDKLSHYNDDSRINENSNNGGIIYNLYIASKSIPKLDLEIITTKECTNISELTKVTFDILDWNDVEQVELKNQTCLRKVIKACKGLRCFKDEDLSLIHI